MRTPSASRPAVPALPPRATRRCPTVVALSLAVLLSICGRAAAAPPLVHPLFSDHMVVQRNARVPVWGWTAPGQRVTVRLLGQQASGRADTHGRWEVHLGPFAAHGPTTMEIVAGSNHVTLQDVLVGDVWLCSGQSNMTMGVGATTNGKAEIARANHPLLRLFYVPKRMTMLAQTTVDGHWMTCTPENLARGYWGGFSATAYFFGRDLQQDLEVPVGLIHSSWEGTPAEAWMSPAALERIPHLEPAHEQLALRRLGTARAQIVYNQRLAAWWKRNDRGSVTAPGWERKDLDTTAWKTMKLPTAWEKAGLPDFDGVVWFRLVVDVPGEWANHDLRLSLGPVDDRDVTYFNGQRVGAMNRWDLPRNYKIPARLMQAGKNVITVRVLDTGGDGGIYGKPEDMHLNLDDTHSISLAGPWQYRVGGALSARDPFPWDVSANNPTVASVLYNGMIAPLVPFAMKGAIWYQGESNSDRSGDYRRVLTALILSWRQQFGPLPFFMVGLAGFEAGASSHWEVVREAQSEVTRTVPATGLALATDIGEAHEIHPHNKAEVGRRLALAARAIAYGEHVACSGPVYRGMAVQGKTVRLFFEHAGGLTLRGKGGFVVAGADRRFVPAVATVDGKSVVVSSTQVAHPVAVRYAWSNNPTCPLYNGANLPAVPFRTDRWPINGVIMHD